jgi:uncharacterized protein YggE
MGYKHGAVFAAVAQQELTGGGLSDGISALGAAVRLLPADILCVSYPVSESVGDQAGTPPSDSARVIKALEAAGLQILEASKRFLSLSEAERPGYFSSGSGTSPGKAATSFETRLSLRITGFRNFASVLRLMEQNGARKISRVLLASSKFDAAREELEKEAIQAAIAIAQSRAAAAGLEAGPVMSVAIAFTHMPAADPAMAVYMPASPSGERAPEQELIAPRDEGELPLLKYSLTASIVMAATRAQP